MSVTAANTIGVALFVLAMAALYASPFFALRRDHQFWRALRERDSIPTKKGSRRHSHSRSSGIAFPELSPDGLDSYGRVPLTAETRAALRSDGGSNTPTRGTA